jgi:hypothetical protein
MNFARYELTSKLFFITGILNFLFVYVVKAFLNNEEIGHRFKGNTKEFFISDIYWYIGFIWILFSLLYLLDDYFSRRCFSVRLKKSHFYLTLPMLLITMLTPIVDTYYPITDEIRKGLFYKVFPIFGTFFCFAFIVGIISFFVNIFKGLFSLIKL